MASGIDCPACVDVKEKNPMETVKVQVLKDSRRVYTITTPGPLLGAPCCSRHVDTINKDNSWMWFDTEAVEGACADADV